MFYTRLATILLLSIHLASTLCIAGTKPIKVRVITVEVIANDDFAQIFENEIRNIDVLNNDFGLFNGVKSLKVVKAPKNGSASVNDNLTIKYTPNTSFVGEDEFYYEVCNTDGSCDEAKVSIRVDDVDFKPIAVNDTVVFFHGQELLIDILKNDTIKGDWPVEVSILEDLMNGSGYLDENNLLVAEFERLFNGHDSLLYIVCDKDDDCDEAWVHFFVKHNESTDFSIPNGFSPNNDGYNDVFRVPDFDSYASVQAIIFNEWGQVVFQSKNYQNDWDGVGNTGTYAGYLCPNGTYYYQFIVDGVLKPLTGYVFLNR